MTLRPRASPRLRRHAGDADDEGCGDKRHAHDERRRDAESGQLAVDEQQGAESERRHPTDAERAVARHEGLGDEEHDAQQDERQPGVVHRQHLQAPECEKQREGADHAGCDEAGVHELEQQPVDADHQQDEHEARITDHGEQATAPVRLQHHDGCLRRRELHAARLGTAQRNHAAVELAQQVADIDGDQVDDLAREGVAGTQAGRLAHRLLGPGDVTAAQLSEAADVGDRVVDALGGRHIMAGLGARCSARGSPRRLRIAAGHRQADRYRRCGAQVGRGRHRRDVCRIQDVGAGACRPRTLRSDETGHRDRGSDDVLDDAAHRRVQPARGVDLQHHELGVVVGRALEGTRNVFGRGRADGTVDAQHEHRRRRGAHVRGDREQHEHAHPPDDVHRKRLHPTRRLTMRAHGDDRRESRIDGSAKRPSERTPVAARVWIGVRP